MPRTHNARPIARSLTVCNPIGLSKLLFACMAVFPCLVQAQDLTARGQSEVEAQSVFNLARFIGWPGNSFADSMAPFVVGVLGDEELRASLTRISAGRTVNGRTFLIRKLVHGQDPRACQILFLGSSEQGEAGTVLHGLRASHVLTIGDSENFIRQGGAVRFFMQNDRMRIEINLDATARAKLTVSAKLLGVAWVTTDERPTGTH